MGVHPHRKKKIQGNHWRKKNKCKRNNGRKNSEIYIGATHWPSASAVDCQVGAERKMWSSVSVENLASQDVRDGFLFTQHEWCTKEYPQAMREKEFPFHSARVMHKGMSILKQWITPSALRGGPMRQDTTKAEVLDSIKRREPEERKEFCMPSIWWKAQIWLKLKLAQFKCIQYLFCMDIDVSLSNGLIAWI